MKTWTGVRFRVNLPANRRAVAQLGRAPASGAGGPGFKSLQPDCLFHGNVLKQGMRTKWLFALLLILTLTVEKVHASGEIPENLKGICLYAPDPEFPMDLVRRGVRGKGVFRVTIDRSTGKVTEVKVIRSTPYQILNELAAKSLLQWRFKPGTIAGFEIPITFEVTGFSRVLH